MEQQIKAIETVYNGYRFRSRLEARWAVFFDALGIKYEYEKEGFDLGDAGWYLPDFWLPDVTHRRSNEKGIWVEIKGQQSSVSEDAKCEALAAMTNSPVALFCGTPKYLFGPDDNDPSNEFGVEWVPKPPDESMLIAANLLTDFAARGLTLRPNGDKINCTPRDLLTDADRQAIRDNRAALLDILICGIAPYVYWDNWMWIWNCPSCNHSKLEFGEGSYDSCPKCNATGGFDSPRLKKAYDAAKQARFEHGETPRF